MIMLDIKQTTSRLIKPSKSTVELPAVAAGTKRSGEVHLPCQGESTNICEDVAECCLRSSKTLLTCQQVLLQEVLVTCLPNPSPSVNQNLPAEVLYSHMIHAA